jgi:hypothetical protein
MCSLPLVVSRPEQKPQPSLVQYERLRRGHEDAPLPRSPTPTAPQFAALTILALVPSEQRLGRTDVFPCRLAGVYGGGKHELYGWIALIE